MHPPEEEELDPYVDFTREEWSRLRASTPLSLAEDDLAALRGLGEPMPMREVEEVYLPLSRLLNLRVAATRELHSVTETFLGHLHAGAPYVIGIAGSVAAGKSTIARMLQALLGRWPDHPARRPRDDRRVLVPERRARSAGSWPARAFPRATTCAR